MNININYIGRLLLSSLFIVTSIRSILNFKGFAGAVASKNIPFPNIVAGIVLGLKLFGGLYLAFGEDRLIKRLFLTGLIIFVILATYLFHNPLVDKSQVNNMLKNIAVTGGLMIIY